MVQLSHPYMTTGKTTALTRWTFVGKVMSLLFNMLSRLVIAFLPKSKYLLISWLQSPICSDFGAQETKVCHCFHCFPIYLLWSDGTGCHDLHFRCWVLSQLFHSPLSLSSGGSLVFLRFLPYGGVICNTGTCCIRLRYPLSGMLVREIFFFLLSLPTYPQVSSSAEKQKSNSRTCPLIIETVTLYAIMYNEVV